jgi:hypothetical protein
LSLYPLLRVVQTPYRRFLGREVELLAAMLGDADADADADAHIAKLLNKLLTS